MLRRLWHWLVDAPAEALLRRLERVEVLCIHSATGNRCDRCERIDRAVNE